MKPKSESPAANLIRPLKLVSVVLISALVFGCDSGGSNPMSTVNTDSDSGTNNSESNGNDNTDGTNGTNGTDNTDTDTDTGNNNNNNNTGGGDNTVTDPNEGNGGGDSGNNSTDNGTDNSGNEGDGNTDGGSNTNNTGGGTTPVASFRDIQARIFTPRCSSCHSGFGAISAGFLVLNEVQSSYANLVGIGSTGKNGATRVITGDPANSYLVQKIEGSGGISGSRMPPNDPLSSEDIQLIKDWIAGGALDN